MAVNEAEEKRGRMRVCQEQLNHEIHVISYMGNGDVADDSFA